VRAQHAGPVGADHGGPHPQQFGSRRVRADRRAAPGGEGLEQAALRGDGGHAGLVGHRPEQRGQLGFTVPAFDGQRPLAGGGRHLVRLEDLGDGLHRSDPGQSGVGQYRPVELAAGHLGQPGAGVPADRHAAQVAPEPEQLRGSPRRAGADPGPGREIGQLGAVPRDQRVPRVIAGRYRGQHDAGRGCGRQVLQRMHDQVHLAAEQCLAQRADEDAGPADLGELRPAGVAQRRHAHDFHPASGPLGDQVSDVPGLRDGHRAPAAAEP
jgi:hypothetical protein